jgi:NNP family nitrate/nitrite transporter-like MFS transporter
MWQTWLLVALYFTTFGGFLALTAWFPTYWGEFFSLSLGLAGALTMVFSVLASLIRVPGGILSDRIGGEKTVILGLSTMLLGSVVMTSANSFSIALVGEILMALGMGIGNAGVFKLVPKYLPGAVGGGAGWVGGLGAFGGFAIPPLMGLFVRVQGDAGYASGFSIFIGLSIISLLLAYLIHRDLSRHSTK